MKIDKIKLHKVIEEQLSLLLHNTANAAKQAYETATHVENKAENKYDTLGLEASYLAAGQSKRVTELENNLQTFKLLKVKDFREDMEVGMGALVCLSDSNTNKKYVFYSPVSGGVEINFQDIKIMLITAASPLGKALKKSFSGDIVTITQADSTITYDVIGLW